MNEEDIKQNDRLLLENYIKLMWGEFNDIRNNYQLAPLIIAFSLIEANAKLCCPEDIEGTQRRFIWWVDNYLNPVSLYKYESLDLYGARCGLFHEYGSGSNISRSGRCREIAWTRGEDRCHHGKGEDNLILLSAEQFFEDLNNAGLFVLKNLQNDFNLQRQFVGRLKKMFGVKNIQELTS